MKSFIKFRYLIAPGCLIVMMTLPLRAQQTTARYLLFRPSATSNAMGGTGVSQYGDAFAAYYNPAALAFSPGLSIVGSFVKPIPFFGNTLHSFLGASYSPDNRSALAVSANLYHTGKQPETGQDPNLLSVIDANLSWQAKISYAHVFDPNFSLGLSASVLRIVLADFDVQRQSRRGYGTGLMFDAGVLFKDLLREATWHGEPGDETTGSSFVESLGGQEQSEGLSIGLSLLNIGTKITEIDAAQSDDVPAMVSFGIGYWPLSSSHAQMMVAIDLEKQIHESSTLDYVHFGGELTFIRLLSVRAGYFLDTYGPANSYGTMGLGFHVKFLNFNVARYTGAIQPTWHFDTVLSLEI